jgi:hypothetical protein
MATQFFKNFPEIQYTLDSGKVITIKDFFRKSKIDTSAVNSIIDYEYYELQEGDRPDVIATNIYGDSDLHWTFFLVNEMNNYYDWWKDNRAFEKYMSHAFGGHFITTHNKSDIVSATGKFLLGETVSCTRDGTTISAKVTKVEPNFARVGTEGDKFQASEIVTGNISGHSCTVKNGINQTDGTAYYYDLNGNKSNTFVNGMYEKTIYDDEWEKNEEKRKIKYIKPQYIKRVVREFNRVMSS